MGPYWIVEYYQEEDGKEPVQGFTIRLAKNVSRDKRSISRQSVQL